MKKFIMTLAMIGGVLSTSAYADENWVYVTDTDVGGRVLIDANNINKHPYDFGKSRKLKYGIEGTVKWINEPEIPEKSRFHIRIDHDQCVEHQHGDMWVTLDNDPRPRHFYWDKSGTKAYDNIGGWLCTFARYAEHLIDENGNPVTVDPKDEENGSPQDNNTTPTPPTNLEKL